MTALTPCPSDARCPLPTNASQPERATHGHLSVCRESSTRSSPRRLLPPTQKATGHLVPRQRVGDVVTPLPRDVQEPAPQPLLAEAELLDHPAARGVLRSDVDLDPVQPDRAE